LGGGGDLGANEVGMLRALLERDILPDLIVGTSIGAINGAAIAAEPSLQMLDRLEAVWRRLGKERIFDSPFRIASTLIRERTHLNTGLPLRRLLDRLLPVTTFEELAVPFQSVAACIERVAEHWFTEGCLIDAIVASSAVPGPSIRTWDFEAVGQRIAWAYEATRAYLDGLARSPGREGVQGEEQPPRSGSGGG